jgi:hypothetical protein
MNSFQDPSGVNLIKGELLRPCLTGGSGTLPDHRKYIFPQPIMWRGFLLHVNGYNKAGRRIIHVNQPNY